MDFTELTSLTYPVTILEMALLLAGAVFMGWLLARWVRASRMKGLRQAIADRQSELDARVAQKRAVDVSSMGTSSPERVASAPIQSVADNLKLLEGIGPKIEGLLNADGIRTFAKLAATSPQHIVQLLSAAGPRFQIHNPTTWPQQAALARDGKWDELKLMQKKLVGGKA